MDRQGNCSPFELAALDQTKITHTLPTAAAKTHFSACLQLFLDFISEELLRAEAVLHTACFTSFHGLKYSWSTNLLPQGHGNVSR